MDCYLLYLLQFVVQHWAQQVPLQPTGSAYVWRNSGTQSHRAILFLGLGGVWLITEGVANHGGAWLITYLTTPVVAVSLRAPSSSSGYFWQPLPTNPVHAKHTQTVRAPILYISVRYMRQQLPHVRVQEINTLFTGWLYLEYRRFNNFSARGSIKAYCLCGSHIKVPDR